MIEFFDDCVRWKTGDGYYIDLAFINKTMPGKYVMGNHEFTLEELSEVYNIPAEDQIIMKLRYGA